MQNFPVAYLLILAHHHTNYQVVYQFAYNSRLIVAQLVLYIGRDNLYQVEMGILLNIVKPFSLVPFK